MTDDAEDCSEKFLLYEIVPGVGLAISLLMIHGNLRLSLLIGPLLVNVRVWNFE